MTCIRHNITYIKFTFAIAIVFMCNVSVAATSVTQHGITWTFDTDYTVGQFVNGDYWVVDSGSGVKITGISPGHTIREGDGRVMNGSMINPSSLTEHGYDSFIAYSAELNVGINVSEQSPLTLVSGNSLVSTVSNETVDSAHLRSVVKTVAVLTCLSSAPPYGSFRPGISGTNKTLYNQDKLQRSLLKKLSYSETKPNILSYAGYFQMVFLSHLGSYHDERIHPRDSEIHNYYFPLTIAEASLMLQLDYPEADKESLLINFIQLGIDLFSYIDSGAYGWLPEGGYGSGKKWPILFAGIMLDSSAMKNTGQVSGDYIYIDGHGPGNWPDGYKSFSEDGQTFYVQQADIDATGPGTYGVTWVPDERSGTAYPYTSALLGMPEWGISYAQNRRLLNSSWTQIYRSIGTGPPAWAGYALSAYIMNAKSLWNHNAFFDYVDRHMAIRAGNPDPFGFTVVGEYSGWVGDVSSVFVRNMWYTYKDSFRGTKYKNVKSITQDQP